MVERVSYTHLVVGSIPTRRTTTKTTQKVVLWFNVPMSETELFHVLRDAVQAQGVPVQQIAEPQNGPRAIGNYIGRTIFLYPEGNTVLELIFTLAHLYGHIVQLASRRTETNLKAVSLVTYAFGSDGNTLIVHPKIYTEPEIQLMFDYESEAMEIGLALLQSQDLLTKELHLELSRIFFADFHYLIHLLETGEGGQDSFRDYVRREPTPRQPMSIDPNPIIDVRDFPDVKEQALVV